MKQTITLEDVRRQLHLLRANGMEGISNITEISSDDQLVLERTERILDAMTEDERTNLDLLLDDEVRHRIASLSGTRPKDVEDLMSQVAKINTVLRRLPSRRDNA